MKNNSEIAIVYPMSKEFVEIIKYRKMLENYEKLIPVSFIGQSVENRDVGESIFFSMTSTYAAISKILLAASCILFSRSSCL